MAVIQISKIQVRRGLEEDLPQLASGEIGWSVDTQRLWIGNGTLQEGAPDIGNTEILTAGSTISGVLATIYSYKGQESGYISQTGPSLSVPVQRQIQDKIDEQISIRDFISTIDKNSGDYTAAFQRAMDEIYPVSFYATESVRRILHVPAGVYEISDAITIPPYATIIGDGKDSTIIKQTNVVSNAVFKLRDSRGQYDLNLGLNSAILPSTVSVTGLTLQNEADSDIVSVNSSVGVSFDNVKFVGSRSVPATQGLSKAAIKINDTVAPSKNITFTRCQFSNVTYGLNIQGDVSSVLVDNSDFDNLYQAVNATAISVLSPRHVKITNSKFNNIAKEAIVSDDNSNIISAFNYFKLVGHGNGSLMDSGAATVPVLSWNNPNNYSIGDVFDRSVANIALFPTVSITSTAIPDTLIKTSAGSLETSVGYTEILFDATAALANTALTITSGTISSIIDYRITRGSTARIGTIKVSQVAGVPIYEDEYSEIGSVGVTLDFTGYGNDAVLQYLTTSTGTGATLKYNVRSFA